jgi:hypothetical protein
LAAAAARTSGDGSKLEHPENKIMHTIKLNKLTIDRFMCFCLKLCQLAEWLGGVVKWFDGLAAWFRRPAEDRDEAAGWP